MPANITQIAGATQIDLFLGNYSEANILASMEPLKIKLATDLDRLIYKNADSDPFIVATDTDITDAVEAALSGTAATLAMFGADGHSVVDSILSQTDADSIGIAGDLTLTSFIQATTAKLTALTGTYFPYHVSDASGLADSILKQTASSVYGVLEIVNNPGGNWQSIPILQMENSGYMTHGVTALNGASGINTHATLIFYENDLLGHGASGNIAGFSQDPIQNAFCLTGFMPVTPTAPALILQAVKNNGAGLQTELTAAEICIRVDNNTTPLLTILGNGAFGAGVIAPTALIHSACSLAVMPQLQLDDTRARAAGNGGKMLFGFKATTGSDIVTALVAIQGYKEANADTNTAGALRFLTNANGGASTIRMIIKSTGIINIANAPNYANNAAAVCNLVAGDVYTVTGSNPLQLAIVY